MFLSFSSTVVFAPFFILIIFNMCCVFLTYVFHTSSLEMHVFKWQACLSAYFFLLGKIEVKILTRKNAEEAGDQWLTEEDTKSFRELLINLLVTN